MKKILVPVDFSTNSRKAIRFAIQMASLSKTEIIFFHIVSLIVPPFDARWDYTYYEQFQDEKLQRNKDRLVKLIKEVYNDKLPSGVKYSCVCQLGNEIGDLIISYAQKHKADFICAGATGTGNFAKLFGTVTTHLITNSPIPIFVIPKNYRLKPLSDICYASDMENPLNEIKKVSELAKSLRTNLKVLHLDYDIDIRENEGELIEIAQKYEIKNISFQYKKLNALYPLHYQLSKAIVVLKPSLVVLFTKQNRKWFERLLITNESVGLSFAAKVPLLVYRKTNK